MSQLPVGKSRPCERKKERKKKEEEKEREKGTEKILLIWFQTVCYGLAYRAMRKLGRVLGS
jgi:hypothetical protein